MADRGGVVAFVAWCDEAGLESSPNQTKVAQELLDLAGEEDLTEQHVELLVQRYRKRFAAPRDIIALRKVGDQMCRWWSERQAPPAEQRQPPPAPELPAPPAPELPAPPAPELPAPPVDAGRVLANVLEAWSEADEPAPEQPAAPIDAGRGLLPDDFELDPRRAEAPQDGVDIDKLPTGQRFRPAVVGSVRAPNSSAPPVSSSFPPDDDLPAGLAADSRAISVRAPRSRAAPQPVAPDKASGGRVGLIVAAGVVLIIAAVVVITQL